MNQNGRLIGGVLIGLALLLIARAATTFSSGNQSSNQFNQNSNNQFNQNQTQDQAFQTPPDRLPISDFNASRVGVAELNPGTSTGDLNTPGSGSDNVADNSGSDTSSGLSPGASIRPAPPIVQGAW